jgi:hypothetical protein
MLGRVIYEIRSTLWLHRKNRYIDIVYGLDNILTL